ncbi:uncharacterized protein N7458_007960 [Penicillium daleae]|uniref:Uncharacterized protein n=1 Tax=Penicillium daleae TaxID=63821 RepID=A0AAD6G1C7_9EURO|nr:uncharacterized protein N7458_007960 [Penicillium daleae]KAJ5444088.1 hypothetical protein N7458_007960 [Penicillium daleae]
MEPLLVAHYRGLWDLGRDTMEAGQRGSQALWELGDDGLDQAVPGGGFVEIAPGRQHIDPVDERRDTRRGNRCANVDGVTKSSADVLPPNGEELPSKESESPHGVVEGELGLVQQLEGRLLGVSRLRAVVSAAHVPDCAAVTPLISMVVEQVLGFQLGVDPIVLCQQQRLNCPKVRLQLFYSASLSVFVGTYVRDQRIRWRRAYCDGNVRFVLGQLRGGVSRRNDRGRLVRDPGNIVDGTMAERGCRVRRSHPAVNWAALSGIWNVHHESVDADLVGCSNIRGNVERVFGGIRMPSDHVVAGLRMLHHRRLARISLIGEIIEQAEYI